VGRPTSTTVAATTADGQAIPIISTSKGTLCVTDRSVTQILRHVTTKKRDKGTANFSHGPGSLTAPPVSQSVSGSQFGL
jgi:hypothetical protein